MTARVHSVLLHRLSVPAWLLAAAIAVVIAASFAVLLAGADDTVPAQAGTSVERADEPRPSACLDVAVVGHC
jgi:hypothetical protein